MRVVGLAAGAALSTFLPAAAFSDDNLGAPPQWSGLYAGGQAGYGVVNSRYVYHSGIPWNAGAEGFVGGLFAGYNHVAGRWLVGGEIEGNLSDFRGQYANRVFGPLYQQDWSAAARLRAGVLTSSRSLLYLSVGAVVGEFDYSNGYYDYFSSPSSLTKYGNLDQTLWGLVIGAGIETFVTRNVSVRAEANFSHYADGVIYQYTRPEDSSVYTADPYALRPDALVARLGVAYHPDWLGGPAVVPAQSFKQSWQGFYVGADAGVSMLNSAEDNDPRSTTPLDPYYTVVNETAAAGGHAGFNWQNGRVVIGVEAGGEWPIGTIGPGSGEHQTWAAGVRGRLGIVTPDNVLFYGSLGWSLAGFDYSTALNPSLGYSGVEFTGQGIQVGAGAEAFLSQRISTRIEALYTDYGEHPVLYYDAPNWTVNPHVLEARIGVTYHLN